MRMSLAELAFIPVTRPLLTVTAAHVLVRVGLVELVVVLRMAQHRIHGLGHNFLKAKA